MRLFSASYFLEYSKDIYDQLREQVKSKEYIDFISLSEQIIIPTVDKHLFYITSNEMGKSIIGHIPIKGFNASIFSCSYSKTSDIIEKFVKNDSARSRLVGNIEVYPEEIKFQVFMFDLSSDALNKQVAEVRDLVFELTDNMIEDVMEFNRTLKSRLSEDYENRANQHSQINSTISALGFPQSIEEALRDFNYPRRDLVVADLMERDKILADIFYGLFRRYNIEADFIPETSSGDKDTLHIYPFSYLIADGKDYPNIGFFHDAPLDRNSYLAIFDEMHEALKGELNPEVVEK
jgi:hypothetical protein